MYDAKPMLAEAGASAEQELRRLTRRSFIAGGAAVLAGLGAGRWLATAEPEHGLPWPLRRVLRLNEGLAETLGSPRGMAPTFSAERVRGPARTNGLIGLDGEVNVADWQLRVEHVGRGAGQTIRLDDVQRLQRHDLVTELKCVEGWSEVMHFGGWRFLDFAARFRLGDRK